MFFCFCFFHSSDEYFSSFNLYLSETVKVLTKEEPSFFKRPLEGGSEGGEVFLPRAPRSKCGSWERRPKPCLAHPRLQSHSLRDMSLGFLVHLKPYDVLECSPLTICMG